jgi:transketolase C-terminal domain/subunit
MADPGAVQTLIEAAETLEGEGIAARVVDCYSVKPIGAATLRAAARATGRIVVAEDRWPEGGLEDVVLGAFPDSKESPRVVKLAVWRDAVLEQAPGTAHERRDRRDRHRGSGRRLVGG